MNAAKLVAAMLTCALSGCMMHSGLAWLESGKIDMRTYKSARVLMLPVEASPGIWLSDAERIRIRNQVKKNLARAYDLDKIEAPEKVDRQRAYPYQRDELVFIGTAHQVAAVAAVSVFALTRTNPLQPDSKAQTLGMRIIFTDATDPMKSWSMSREYHSDGGFATGSDRLDATVLYDLEAAKPTIDGGQGFFGVMKNVVTFNFRQVSKPRVNVNVISADTLAGASVKQGGTFSFFAARTADGAPLVDMSKTSAEAGAAFRGDSIDPTRLQTTYLTEQSSIRFQFVAEDVTGLVQTEVTNRKTGWKTSVSHELDGADKNDSPRRVEDLVYVPIAEGLNSVEFVTTNQQGKTSTTVLSVTRKVRESVYTVGVGISQYLGLGRQKQVQPEKLKNNFEKVKGRWPGDALFLENQEATQRQIERSLYDLGMRTNTNDMGLGIFYFAGKVQAEDSGVFLMAYDSEPQFAEVTGISTDLLQKLLPEKNSKAILDLCEPDQRVQARLRNDLPGALISFDSCSAGDSKIANQVAALVDGGQTLKQAITDVSTQQASVKLAR